MKYKYLIAPLLALLASCGENSVKNGPEGVHADCNLVSIVSVGDASAENNLRSIVVSMSDREGNSLTFSVLSGHTYLEAGYYDIVASAPAGRMEAKVEAVAGGADVAPSAGTIYVRKNNWDYWIDCSFEGASGETVRFLADGKKLYFNSSTYPSVWAGGDGTELRDCTYDSSVLGRRMLYSVLLPEGYDESRSYPVLYMLHGMDGDNNDWLGRGAMNAYLSQTEGVGDMIIICPDGENLFWCNDYDPGVKFMDYFFSELLPEVESLYAVDKSRRCVGGLSMGGYGSLYYGLLHPEMFRSVYACSPATGDGMNVPDLVAMLAAHSASPGGVRSLPELTIEIGTSDFLYGSVEAFVRTLDSYNVAYELITRSGAHDWPFWNACSPKVLVQTHAACLL